MSDGVNGLFGAVSGEHEVLEGRHLHATDAGDMAGEGDDGDDGASAQHDVAVTLCDRRRQETPP